MPTTGPVSGAALANEISVTLQAQQIFENAVSQLNSIVSNALDAQNQLTTSAMVTTAGQKFGSKVVQWCEDFDDLRGTLQWMAQQLGDTAHQLQASNQAAVEAAAQLPAFGSFG
jgi:hypothetical protein